MSKQYTNFPEQDAVEIITDILRRGKSEGFYGTVQQRVAVAAVLSKFNVEYVDNMKGEWTVVEHPAQTTLNAIRDRLFLDIDGTEEFYNFDKAQDAYIWERITERIRDYFKMNPVTCALCGKSVWIEEAHLHENEHIGACCWDDRLKASE